MNEINLAQLCSFQRRFLLELCAGNSLARYPGQRSDEFYLRHAHCTITARPFTQADMAAVEAAGVLIEKTDRAAYVLPQERLSLRRAFQSFVPDSPSEVLEELAARAGFEEGEFDAAHFASRVNEGLERAELKQAPQ